jgi:WD repeat-containing protein 35
MMHKQHWFEEMINNRNKSVVKDMKWTPNGEKKWSPDSRMILFGNPAGEVKAYDYVGNLLFPLRILCLRGLEGRESQLAAIEWYDNNR